MGKHCLSSVHKSDGFLFVRQLVLELDPQYQVFHCLPYVHQYQNRGNTIPNIQIFDLGKAYIYLNSMWFHVFRGKSRLCFHALLIISNARYECSVPLLGSNLCSGVNGSCLLVSLFTDSICSRHNAENDSILSPSLIPYDSSQYFQFLRFPAYLIPILVSC